MLALLLPSTVSVVMMKVKITYFHVKMYSRAERFETG